MYLKFIFFLFASILIFSCSSDDDSSSVLTDDEIINLCDNFSLHSDNITILNAEIESIHDPFILQKSYLVTVELKNTSNNLIFGDVNIVADINGEQIIYNGSATECSQLSSGSYCLTSFQQVIDYELILDENPSILCTYFIEN